MKEIIIKIKKVLPYKSEKEIEDRIIQIKNSMHRDDHSNHDKKQSEKLHGKIKDN